MSAVLSAGELAKLKKDQLIALLLEQSVLPPLAPVQPQPVPLPVPPTPVAPPFSLETLGDLVRSIVREGRGPLTQDIDVEGSIHSVHSNLSRTIPRPVLVDPLNLTPVLADSTTFNKLRAGETPPVYFDTIFSSYKWPFPSGVSKDGHLSGSFIDSIGDRLLNRASSTPAHRTVFLQYSEEWKTLHQSILYLNLLSLALHQLQNSLLPVRQQIVQNLQEGEALFDSLSLMASIMTNLMSDTMSRVDTVSTVASGGLSAGQSVFSNQNPRFDSGAMLSANALKFVQSNQSVRSQLSTDSSLNLINTAPTTNNHRRGGGKTSTWTPRDSLVKESNFHAKRQKKEATAAPSSAAKKDG